MISKDCEYHNIPYRVRKGFGSDIDFSRAVKILVGGPYHSGKTTLVHNLDPDALSIDKSDPRTNISTTVGLDQGKVVWVFDGKSNHGAIMPVSQLSTLNNCPETFRIIPVMIIGCPGQMRFQVVRESLMRGGKGVLFVVDATNPGQVGHAIALYEEVHACLGDDIPLILLANKQDIKGAMSAEEVANLLKICDVPVIETSALTGIGIREAISLLLRYVLARISGDQVSWEALIDEINDISNRNTRNVCSIYRKGVEVVI